MTEWPDKTLSELADEEDFDDELIHTSEEIEGFRQELYQACEIQMAGSVLARMVENDDITLAEYDRLTEILTEYERELDSRFV